MTDVVSFYQHQMFANYGIVPSPNQVREAIRRAYRVHKTHIPTVEQVKNLLPKR